MSNPVVRRTAACAVPLPPALAAECARAAGLDARYERRTLDLMEPAQWMAGPHRFHYRPTAMRRC